MGNDSELYAVEMSRQWAKAVKGNPRTPSFRAFSEDQCIAYAKGFYGRLKENYSGEPGNVDINDYFDHYAEMVSAKGVPLHEAIYSLIMMRRGIWLYRDFQPLFLSDLDNREMIDVINSTILIFDHGIYRVMQRYEELQAS